MRRTGAIGGLVLAALGAAAPARAEWLRAQTEHFVVYSDTSRDALTRSATELERFDAMIRRIHRKQADPDAAFNRVTVYVVPDAARVAKMAGQRNIAGYYLGRVTGSVAFTPRGGGGGTFDLSPRLVLFHEYAHHFLLGNSSVAYPVWFSEGYAEFASTMMEKGGAYWLGAAANHRSYGLFDGKPLSIRQILSPPATMDERQMDALYGRGWLLTHYMMLDAARQHQLSRYLDLLNEGKPSLDAAAEAFGDLKALDRALDTYLNRATLPAIRVEKAALGTPEVEVRPLTAGEAALIGYRMESTSGVNAKTAAPLYAKAAAVAAAYPKDAVAQGWLAEMAMDAGRLDAAEAAADAALAVDPAQGQALLYKAQVHLARAAQAKATDPAVWKEARSWITRANRANNNDAGALALFYQSFLMQDATPTKNAVAALYRATTLVPQDSSVRFLAARQLLLDGDTVSARKVLRALAASPHSGFGGEAARLLALLDAGQTGPAAVEALRKAAEESAAPTAGTEAARAGDRPD